MKWPGATSDYMAWLTSALCKALKDNHITKEVLEGFTFVGDNTHATKIDMAVLLKGMRGGYKDRYNLYMSQFRITTERAFDVFVH